jgi:hypothetical protein
MTESASCRNPFRAIGSLQFGDWAQETSDRGGQDKANWRSRTRRSSAIAKPLSAHWFLKTRRLALRPRLAQAGWRRSSFPSNFNTPADGARGLHFKVPAFFSISCAWLRFYAIDPSRLLREAQAMRIVSSWRKIKATIFMCGLDALVAAGPGSIRAAISGPSRS